MTNQLMIKWRARSRADQILDAFIKHHRQNPAVWELFIKFALQAVHIGREHYSANAIFERIRWHVEIETKGSEVKLGNNFRAYYARLFHLAYPEHDGFFRNRKLTSEDAVAYEHDKQLGNMAAPSEEESITERLKELL